MSYILSLNNETWWVVTTLTMVGYGDMYQITTGGKIYAFFVLMTWFVIVAIPTGLIVSAFAQARKEIADEKARSQSQIDI